eukprot:6417264-Heterocapsa_arctica.AAC.1
MLADTVASRVEKGGPWRCGPAIRSPNRATRLRRRVCRCSVRVDVCFQFKKARDEPGRDANHI